MACRASRQRGQGGPDLGFRGGGRLCPGKGQRRGSARTGAESLPFLRLLLGHVHRQLDELPLEALGIALPGNGTILARTPERDEHYRRSAERLLHLIEDDVRPLDIITPRAIDNAFALDMAMGGSTNTVLHALALCNEGGVEYPLERLNDVAARVPYICKVSPASAKVHIEDVHRAGASARSCMS